MEKTALNEEIPAQEWQQKIKHAMKGLNYRWDVNTCIFYTFEKPKATTLSILEISA